MTRSRIPATTTLLLAAFVITLLVFVPSAAAQQAGTIATVAGGGPNNLPALAANVASPVGVAVDSAGNFYVVARDQNRVFKVDTAGLLTVVAGNGVQGFSGDGGPATSASLAQPFLGVAVDASGNLFIADTANQRIRRVDAASGIITTVAGNGLQSFSGDGGPAAAASLGNPHGLAVDADGNLVIADHNNHRVRRVDAGADGLVTGASDEIIATVAGNGHHSFSGDGGPATSASVDRPNGVAVDANSNLFISDTTQRIRRVDATTGIITTVAGDGLFGFSGDGGRATSASLGGPEGVALDASGNLYIADGFKHRIRKVDGASGIITTVAGNGVFGFSGDGGPAISASLANPFGIAAGADRLYIADFSNNRIRQVDAGGVISTLAGNGTLGFSGDGGPATGASLFGAGGVVVDSTGSLFIADAANQRIRRVDAATGTITTAAGNGTAGFSGDDGPSPDASLRFPTGVALDANGNLFIADRDNRRIRRVDATTGIISTVAGNGVFGFSGDGGPATSASLSNPTRLAVDGAGNLYIADGFNHRIRKVDGASGIITTVAGSGTSGFSGDGGPATGAILLNPVDVAVDSVGNLYIAQFFSPFEEPDQDVRIRKVDAATGIITTVAGIGTSGFSGDGGPATDASLRNPFGVAVDASGNLFIADSGNNRIRRVDAATGIITTVAGEGQFGFSGDGGPATSARLANPTGVAVDASGNLFLADISNRRIRRVVLNHPPVADAGPDQCVPCTTAGATQVTLDGSGSFDPDGDQLTYRWTGAFLEGDGVATGVSPTVTLPLGKSAITLVVNDGKVDSAPDTVDITVKVRVAGLEPPLAAIALDGTAIPHPARAFKQGRVLPLKLQLFCGLTELTDADVSPPEIVALVRDGDAMNLETLDTGAGEANDSGLLFRFSDDRWGYNLKTADLSTGTYIITLRMPDGVRYSAVFVLR